MRRPAAATAVDPPPPVNTAPATSANDDDDTPVWRRILAAFTYVPERVSTFNIYGRVAALALCLVWGGWFMLQDWRTDALNASFLHRVDLVFHEFGHVLFTPFGRLMMFLGGSIFQVLMPLIVVTAFVFFQRNPFGGAVALAWAAQAVLDVAPYIDDARALQMGLIGEWSEDAIDARAERHDWHNILSMLGWLRKNHGLATGTHYAGCALMVVAWAWGASLLVRQWKNRSDVLLEDPDRGR